jgi:GDPmannose 4,6-dehydratase
MPSALVTGVSGQDGHYLSRSLLSAGYEVHGIVRDADDAEIDPRVIRHSADLTEGDRLRSITLEVAPDEIYNLAALSSVFLSWKEPVLTAQINGMAVAHLLDAALALQEAGTAQPRFVQASSAELFGQAEYSPQNEDTPIRPTSPYGASKAFAHHLVRVYRGRGLFASNCILYNHESPRRPQNFVTRKITQGAARIARGLQDELVLGNLHAARDWGWAPDFARALELAARADEPDDFVVATGQTHTVQDFVVRAFERAGIEDWSKYVTVSDEFQRPVDPAQQVGDASRARSILAWAPSVTFEQIVYAMVDTDLSIIDGEQSHLGG